MAAAAGGAAGVGDGGLALFVAGAGTVGALPVTGAAAGVATAALFCGGATCGCTTPLSTGFRRFL